MVNTCQGEDWKFHSYVTKPGIKLEILCISTVDRVARLSRCRGERWIGSVKVTISKPGPVPWQGRSQDSRIPRRGGDREVNNLPALSPHKYGPVPWFYTHCGGTNTALVSIRKNVMKLFRMPPGGKPLIPLVSVQWNLLIARMEPAAYTTGMSRPGPAQPRPVCSEQKALLRLA